LNDQGCDSGVGPSGCMSSVGKQYAGTSCDSCPAGKAGGGGLTACSHCIPGQYTDTTAQGTCKKCPNGKFQDGTGKTGCKACPFGQKGYGTGKTSCETCESDSHSVDPGVADATQGATECSPCPAGSIPSTIKHGCDICGAGKYRDSTTFTCENCVLGTYSTSGGSEDACPDCPIGKYGPNPVSTCVNCPSGQAQAAKGQPVGNAPEVCVNCPSGRRSNPPSGKEINILNMFIYVL
jgi:hypothetical protein